MAAKKLQLHYMQKSAGYRLHVCDIMYIKIHKSTNFKITQSVFKFSAVDSSEMVAIRMSTACE